jgi:hypothetical protein
MRSPSQLAHTTFAVRTHSVTVECLEKRRWRVTVDGRLLATFCSENRARVAGRTEARRLEFIALDERARSAAGVRHPK